MSKPTKAPKAIRESDFLKRTKPSGIQAHRVIRFFDPLSVEAKRDSAAKFSQYLERQRRALKKTAKKSARRVSRNSR